MATERTLNIELRAKDAFSRVTTKFDRTMGASGRAMGRAFDIGKRAANGMRRAVKTIGTALKAALIPLTLITTAFSALSGGGLFALVKSAANSADSLQKLSERLALSVEFLSEMRFVAERTGVNVNALGVGIQRVTRRMSEFRETGAGAGAAGFNLLGQEVIDAVNAGESFEQLLPKLAQGFQNLESQQDRVRAAFSLFDSEGVSFVQFLQLGEEGIAKLRDRARELGGVIQGDAAQSAAAFNDAMLDLVTALKGVRNEIGAGLFEFLAEKLQESAKWISENRDRLALFITAGAKLGISVFGRLFDFVRTKLGEYRENWRTALSDMGDNIKFVAQFLIDSFEAAALAIAVVFTTLANKLPRVIQAGFRGFSLEDLIKKGDGFASIREDLEKLKSLQEKVAQLNLDIRQGETNPFEGAAVGLDGSFPDAGDVARNLAALREMRSEAESELRELSEKLGEITGESVKRELQSGLKGLGDGLLAVAEKFGDDLSANVRGNLFSGSGGREFLDGVQSDFLDFQRTIGSPGSGQGALFGPTGPGLFRQFQTEGPQIFALQGQIEKAQKDITDEVDNTDKAVNGLRESFQDVADFIPSTFGEGFREQADRIREDFTSFPAIGRDSASELFGAFDQSFFSAMQGELRSLEDFFEATFLSIAQSAQRILSGILAGQLVNGLGGLFGGGGGGGSPLGTAEAFRSLGPAIGSTPGGGAGEFFASQSGSFLAPQGAAGGDKKGDVHLHIHGEIADGAFWERNSERILGEISNAASRNNTARQNLLTVTGR